MQLTEKKFFYLSSLSLSSLPLLFPSLSFVLLFVFIFVIVCVLMTTAIVFIAKLVRHCWRHFVRHTFLCDHCHMSLCLLMIALILYREYLFLNKIVLKPNSIGCPKIFPLSTPVLYWLSHLTCISSLKAKNDEFHTAKNIQIQPTPFSLFLYQFF